ncbi:hypothetical protein BWI17_12510 [Betaproteobacteria bacterium GR16-43]|nr:hypothetical protein BWI17_12510 [Betaproteobacteria bacterium GR16-43]
MIRGLLLAGGAATRFGSAKLLHAFEGSTLGAVSARNLIAGVGNAMAVVRPGDDALANTLRAAGCEVLVSERSREGLASSIAAGVGATRNASGWVLALADMPRIAPDITRTVARAIEAGALIAAPVLRSGERGHPVGFGSSLVGELVALTGDGGAREVIERHRARLVSVSTEDRGVLYDVDRPTDLGSTPSDDKPLTLRRATAADAELLSLLALRSKAHWGYAESTMESWRDALRIEADALERHVGYVALQGEAMVGFYVLAPGARAWVLEHLWVDPPCMRRGFGRAMVHHAIETARRGGAHAVLVDSDPNARAFYLACGAVLDGEVAAPIPGDPRRVRPQLRFSV